MNNKIYFDNNATTKIDEEVLNVMLPYFNEKYGNPSSLYYFGKEIEEEIFKARQNIAKMINAKEDEIIFTSCASESNTASILNAAKSSEGKNHIITSKFEHHAILHTCEALEKEGFEVTYLDVYENGIVHLITVMLANNEIGNIYPIKEIGRVAKEKNIYFHCDAVQGIGKINVDVKELNVTTLSFSGHKIYVPKGIGVLYVKEGTKFNPLIFGHQEKNRRGGTENVPYIIALGKAAELIINDNYCVEKSIKDLRDYMEDRIKKEISDIYIYGDIENRIPNTSNIAFKGVTGDELIFILEANDIFISTGSACNSKISVPSHVLTACNANLGEYSPIRISLGKYNTKEEIDIFINILKKNIESIRKRRV